jgi:hypothetical protein
LASPSILKTKSNLFSFLCVICNEYRAILPPLIHYYN